MLQERNNRDRQNKHARKRHKKMKKDHVDMIPTVTKMLERKHGAEIVVSLYRLH